MPNDEQKDNSIIDASKAPFQGIRLHCIGYFPINLLERRETYEKTLSLFEISPEFGDNTGILNRPTHVFRLLGRQEGLKVLCGKDYSKKKKDKIPCKTVHLPSKRT